jgi:hypothetical protein
MRRRAFGIAGLLVVAALGVPRTHAQEPSEADGWALQVFDVRDLLERARDFPAPRLGLSVAKAPAAGADQPAAAAALAAELRALPGLLWDAPASIETRGAALVVRHRRSALAAIAAALAARREAAQRLVRVEARFLSMEGDAARALPKGLHVIDPLQAERLLDLARRNANARILQSPQLTAFDGQQANVLVANQVAYVARVELEAAPGALVADPVVETLQEGTALTVRARRDAEGWYQVELDVQVATLLRPMDELRTRYGVIQVPQLVAQATQGRVRVPDRGWVLVAGLADVPSDGSTPGSLLVLVRVVAVTPDGAAAPGGK